MNKQDELLIASYYALEWWHEAQAQEYFRSEDFDKFPFRDEFVKSRLKSDGGSIALLMPSLYVALVLPRETIFYTHKNAFQAIDQQLVKYSRNIKTTYLKEQNGPIYFTRHIRNAVSHARVEWVDDGIMFYDENKRTNEEFEGAINLDGLNFLIFESKKIILKRVAEIQAAQSKENNA
jgi:hypothetical protein